jgi:hypothetical protein
MEGRELREQRGPSDDRRRADDISKPVRSEGVITASPLLLFGVGIAATSIIRGGPWYAIPTWRLYLSIAVGVLAMGVIGGGALAALSRRMPDWGWTWVGSSLIEAALLIQSVLGEARDAGYMLPAWAETALTAIFLAVGGGLLVWAAMRGWRLAGLFSLGAAGTFGLSMYLAIIAGPFFRHDLALLAAPLGLVYAGLVFVYMRTGGISALLLIAAVGVLNAASFFMANRVWGEWLVAQSRSSPLVPLVVLGTGLLISGPLLAWLLRPLRAVSGRSCQ